MICDNTATCRIFGEQVTNWGYTLSVLFTRPAGADSKITGEVKYNYYERDDFNVKLFINGKNHGEVEPKEVKDKFGSEMVNTLDDDQIHALIAALKGSPKIEFKNLDQDISMQLSTEGFNAVWLKMREWQGLLKEQRPREPKPEPVIKKVKFIGELQNVTRDDLRFEQIFKILKKLPESEKCDIFDGDSPGFNDDSFMQIQEIDENRTLVQARCQMTGYIPTALVVVVMDDDLSQVSFVTTDFNGTDENGDLRHESKVCGGSEWYHKTAVWDGEKFVVVEDRFSGPCSSGEAGGAWNFPIITGKVAE